MDNDGNVIPLQQCVDVNFETENSVVDSGAWLQAPSSLMRAFEPTPVSRQLDAELDAYPDGRRVNGQGKVTGALRRFVSHVMAP